MGEEPQSEPKKDLESEVWSAISAFEQILQAMPGDRGALEVLSHAYRQIGDHTKAKEHTVRLAEVLMEEGDTKALAALLDGLKAYAVEDPSVRELVERAEGLKKGGGAVSGKEPTRGVEEASPDPAAAVPAKGFNIANELAFAWSLLEAEDLTQEEYASVVQDLSEMGASDTFSTVSVLHVLEARGFRKLERIMARIAREFETPFLSLGGFDPQVDALRLLPREFMVRRGAAAFAMLGRDALVVVMNPHDKQLRHDVTGLAGRQCHFYITMPSEFDRAMDRFAAAMKEEQSG